MSFWKEHLDRFDGFIFLGMIVGVCMVVASTVIENHEQKAQIEELTERVVDQGASLDRLWSMLEGAGTVHRGRGWYLGGVDRDSALNAGELIDNLNCDFKLAMDELGVRFEDVPATPGKRRAVRDVPDFVPPEPQWVVPTKPRYNVVTNMVYTFTNEIFYIQYVTNINCDVIYTGTNMIDLTGDEM